MKIVLILAVIFIPLILVLYYFGIGVTKAGIFIVNASYSLPARWEGKLSDASGYMRRNFVVFKKYSALSIAVETASGGLEFEVKGPDGTPLSPSSCIYGRDRSFLIDLSGVKRCAVNLRADHFSGTFRITLQ